VTSVTTATPTATVRTVDGRFRIAAVAEACSWAGLLIGMLFKYVVVKNPIGVQVFGPVHGICFLAYVVSTVLVARARRWSAPVTAVGLLASIPPFGTLVFERWAQRSGQLSR
jgi:integral membrane protein